MKVEEIKKEIEKLSQEEKQRLMRELMSDLCQEILGGGSFKEGIMSMCMETIKESPMQEMVQKIMMNKETRKEINYYF